MSVPLLVSMVPLNIHREVIRAVWHSSDRFGVDVIVLPWDSILGALERVIGGVVL